MSKNRIKNATIEELMEKLEYCGHDGYYNKLYYPVIEEIKRRLKKPKEQPERKHGKWIPKDDERYHCSSCNGRSPKGYRWNYCPNCGADMREDEG